MFLRSMVRCAAYAAWTTLGLAQTDRTCAKLTCLYQVRVSSETEIQVIDRRVASVRHLCILSSLTVFGKLLSVPRSIGGMGPVQLLLQDSPPQNLDNLSAMLSAWIAHAAEPNLPFCEEAFAVSPHVAQVGSCLAHMPYVAVVLLGLTGFPLLGSPSLLPAIDARERVGGKADEVNDTRIARRLLWIQVALQTFTGLAGT